MSYFAEIDSNKRVLRVIVCDSREWCEQRLGGTWVETTAEDAQKQYAGIGMFDADGIAPRRFVPHGKPDEDAGDFVVGTLTGNTILYATPTAWWGDQVAELPDTGTVEAGSMYYYGETLYQVLVTHSRDQWGGDPEQWPTYIRRVRKPGEVREWEASRDRYDAYWLVNPFTGQPDQCTYNGKTWTVTAGNAAGTNTWPPEGENAYGWTAEGADEWPEFVQPMAGDPGYMTGDKVTFNGKHYISLINANMHSPAAAPRQWSEQA